MEAALASLLQYGTWIASLTITLGLFLAFLKSPNSLSKHALQVTAAGIAMFILLPALRVILMLLVFLRRREYRFVCIAGGVLLILVVGLLVGGSQAA
jgi:uncharacterized membrane protein